jgi:diguanylate cyclase (GGDEF)-like protein
MERRTRWWAALAVVVFAIAFAVWIAFEPGGHWLALVVSDGSAVLVSLLAGLACMHTAKGVEGRTRWGWTLLGAGMMSWSLGETMWGFYEVVLGVEVPFPSVADIGYLGSVPLSMAGIAALVPVRTRAARTVLDGLIISGSLLYVSWATALGSIFRNTELTTVEWAVSIAYPLADLAIASMVLILLSQADRTRWAPLGILAAGMLSLAVADTAFAYLVEIGAYVTGHPVDTAWIVGYMLIGLAALWASETRGAAELVTHPKLQVALPYIPLGIALGASAILPITREKTDPFLYFLGTTLVLLVVFRQIFTLRDNMQLTQELTFAVRDLREREGQLRFMAFHDPLTGLANRALFQDRVEHALQARQAGSLGVLYIDLDHFKPVNDSLGHGAGDEVLVTVGRRIAAVVRRGDTVARLGGDEFAVLMDRLDGSDDAIALATRIVEAVAEPVQTNGSEVTISASVGVAVQGADSVGSGELLRDADIAMYAAKVSGKGRYAMFDIELRTGISGQVSRERPLIAPSAVSPRPMP